MSNIIEQDFPYELLNRGHRDAARHNKKVDDAARKQLKDIISQQDIITSAGNKKVKVKLKYLDEYTFRHNKDYFENIGRDQFNELDEGELLHKPQKGGSGGGGGGKGGQEEGDIVYEAEFTIDQLTDMMFEELQLPDLDERKKNEITTDVIEYTDIQKRVGVMSRLDKKKTIFANIKRRAALGKDNEEIEPINEEDLRFRTWNVAQEKHSNAVVFLMLDRSGSMSEEKLYAVKALYFWIVQFLKRKYENVEIKFIAHDMVARELNEKEFFSYSSSGGTKISAAYELCRDMIKNNYPTDIWNVYAFHSSDGDSSGDENYCVTLIKEILALGAILFAYTEVYFDEWKINESQLLTMLKNGSKIKGLAVSEIAEMSDILSVLRVFLQKSSRTS